MREVEEETGLEGLRLGEAIITTHHTFVHKKKWRLKTTHWYRMQTHSQPLIPQLEEDITQAAWMSKAQWLSLAEETYPLTQEIFQAEFAKDL